MAKKAIDSNRSMGIVGQVPIRRQLAEGLRADRTPHACLFVGPDGIGKTAIALEFARLLLCEENGIAPCETCPQCRLSAGLQHPDLHLILPLPAVRKSGSAEDDDADETEQLSDRLSSMIRKIADDPYCEIRIEDKKSGGESSKKGPEHIIRIGQIRTLLRQASLKPYQASRKVFVIMHADGMNTAAQNAFLKVLEEPPDSAYFLLTSSRESLLRPTVRSRCRKILVPPLSSEVIGDTLIKAGIAAERANAAAVLSGGSLSHARELASGSVDDLQSHVIEYLKASATCDPIKLPVVSAALMDTGELPRTTGLELLSAFLRDAALVRVSDESKIPSLAFGKFRSTLEGVVAAFPDADLETAIQAVDESALYLSRGYTESFVLFSLAVRLRDCLGSRSNVKIKATQTAHD